MEQKNIKDLISMINVMDKVHIAGRVEVTIKVLLWKISDMDMEKCTGKTIHFIVEIGAKVHNMEKGRFGRKVNLSRRVTFKMGSLKNNLNNWMIVRGG